MKTILRILLLVALIAMIAASNKYRQKLYLASDETCEEEPFSVTSLNDDGSCNTPSEPYWINTKSRGVKQVKSVGLKITPGLVSFISYLDEDCEKKAFGPNDNAGQIVFGCDLSKAYYKNKADAKDTRKKKTLQIVLLRPGEEGRSETGNSFNFTTA